MHSPSYPFFGSPKRCRIPSCRHRYYKDSFQGFLMNCVSEHAVVMCCPKCGDKRLIAQPAALIAEYKESLPDRPVTLDTTEAAKRPITIGEMKRVNKEMDDPKFLTRFNQNARPGGATPETINDET